MPKLFWANLYCLLDCSSGASISAREQLRALAEQGFDVRILGATVFDDEGGSAALGKVWDRIRTQPGRLVTMDDGDLTHELLITGSTRRGEVRAMEEAAWFGCYRKILESWRPDIVYFYGGQPFDYLIADEARHAGAKVAFYLVNGNYHTDRWHRDVDLVVTDTRATADLYAKRLGIAAEPVGTFIDARRVVGALHDHRHLLFVSPSFAKGGALVARLAILMESRRPHIKFEIVRGRGDWDEMLGHAFRSHDEPPHVLSNVVVTPHSADMRPVYRRARLLLAPSLWWESGSRVIIEALMNGIPAIVTAHGGSPEVQGGAGPQIGLPDTLHAAPYQRLPTDEALLPLIEEIERLYDDEEAYQAVSRQALQVAARDHDMHNNASGLASIMRALIGDESAS
ncbi:glycosyltransferase [Parasphingorhabdus sp.]|uniref:glycosyltransferase n=1 Tax=Parasphingorhabdus sp. TaxID=2709688 RepID=UPI003002ADD6